MDLRKFGARLADASPRGALGSIADLVAVAAVIVSGVSLVKDGAFPQDVLAIAVCLIALTFLGISFALQRRLDAARGDVERALSGNARLGRTGDALPALSVSVENLARAAVVASKSVDGFLRHAENGCKELANMYGIATGKQCRVTLLEVYAPYPKHDGQPQRLAVRMMCTTQIDRGRHTPNAQPDFIEDNSDFLHLLTTGEHAWFCNDLPGELANGYRNSHWTAADIAEFRRTDSWPYRSTIVWPIRAYDIDAGGQWDIAGFLCVDSAEAEVFDRSVDVATGETFAHAIYSSLDAHLALRDADSAAGNGGTT